MDSDLRKLIDEHVQKEFRPASVYHREGDFLTLYVADTDCYSERVDDTLTIFREDDTDNIVGVKIKGVKRLLAESEASDE